VNNPGWGLSDNMTKIMSHSGQPDEASLRASKSLVWAVAPRPNTCDRIIRHRYDDPKTAAEPAKVSSCSNTQGLLPAVTLLSTACMKALL
jgi:hypothetical protein